MAFPQSFLDELIARNDIVDVVGSYVTLQAKGGSYWGCCPFHNEKTPSFHVLPDKQFYHCFGCKKGGGVINFVMDMENLSYPDAVRFLAKRANMEVPEDDRDGSGQLRKRILALNRRHGSTTTFSSGRRAPPSGPIWTTGRSVGPPPCGLAWAPLPTAGILCCGR